MRYTVRWSNTKSPYEKPKEYEYSEFQVEEDPDPPGDWKVWYRWFNGGGHIDYWVWRKSQRRSGIEARELICVAGRAELLRISLMSEPRLVQISRLALQLETSRAQIENRPSRRFEGLCAEI